MSLRIHGDCAHTGEPALTVLAAPQPTRNARPAGVHTPGVVHIWSAGRPGLPGAGAG